jgi:hypothetical protein
MYPFFFLSLTKLNVQTLLWVKNFRNWNANEAELSGWATQWKKKK